MLAEVSEAIPPISPETVTATESASRPLPTRSRSGVRQSASFTFSHMMRLPIVFRAPVTDTIRNAGSSDQRKASRVMPSIQGSAPHGERRSRSSCSVPNSPVASEST